jgi:hypothetical protein
LVTSNGKELGSLTNPIAVHIPPAQGNAMSAAAPPAQRLAVSSGGALDDVAVVDLVLRFAGSRQALFLQINKTWTACYERISNSNTAASHHYNKHSANCTSLEAVFGSAARLKLALERGLQPKLDSFSVHRAAGKVADTGT